MFRWLVCAIIITSPVTAVPALNPGIVERINSNPLSTWSAKMSPRFANASTDDVARLCGGFRSEGLRASIPEISHLAFSAPTDFDAREAWPQCKSTIAHVRDQSDCGSCWAFATTESFNDRLCVANNFSKLLSPLDMGECCNIPGCRMNNDGCVGGIISQAWKWLVSDGVVTGGDHADINKTDTCKPYPFWCTHNSSNHKEPLCPSKEYTMPKCNQECSNAGYPAPYGQDKVKASKTFTIPRYPLDTVYHELMHFGPVSSVFTVFDDFIHYSGGVYKHLEGGEVGSHAIEIIGWGVDKGENYWWVKNSWGSTWGLNGYFKIGYGECGIENTFTSGYV